MSIRRSVLTWLALLLSTIGLIGAAASYVLMRYETDNFLDSQLRQIAYYVGDAPRGPLHSVPTDPLYDPEDDFVVQIWDRGGNKIYESDPDIVIPRQETSGFADLTTNDKSWRTYSYDAPDRTVQISQDMVVREELATSAALRSALPVAVCFPLSWLLLTLVINRIINRLRRVVAIVEHQDVSASRALPLEDVPLEIQPLVQAMNELVDRLRTAVVRQQRFVSDAAHELRTPLAALTLQVGNLRRVAHGRDVLDRLKDVEAGVRRASRLVSQLLRLARYDSNPLESSREAADLSEVAIRCVEEVRPLLDEKEIRVSASLKYDAKVSCPAGELSLLVSNILDNAVKYSPRGSEIEVATSSHNGRAVLSISDTGPGIPAEMQNRVFERFVRAAAPDIDGSGLGLSIVRSIADRYGMTIALENRSDARGLIVRVEAPTF
jgi:two-component system, OmpR family, sensor kinase